MVRSDKAVIFLTVLALFALLYLSTASAGTCLDKDLGVCVDAPSADRCPGGYFDANSAATQAVCAPGACCCYTEGGIPQGVGIVIPSACKTPVYPGAQVWVNPSGVYTQDACTYSCALYYVNGSFVLPNVTGNVITPLPTVLPNQNTTISYGNGLGVPINTSDNTTIGVGINISNNTPSNIPAGYLINLTNATIYNGSDYVAYNSSPNGTLSTNGTNVGNAANVTDRTGLIIYYPYVRLTGISVRSVVGPDINGSLIGFDTVGPYKIGFSYLGSQLSSLGISAPADGLSSTLYPENDSSFDKLDIDTQNGDSYTLIPQLYSLTTYASKQGIGLVRLDLQPTNITDMYHGLDQFSIRSRIGNGDDRLIIGLEVKGADELNFKLINQADELIQRSLPAAKNLRWEAYDERGRLLMSGNLSNDSSTPSNIGVGAGTYTFQIFSNDPDEAGYAQLQFVFDTHWPAYPCAGAPSPVCGMDNQWHLDACSVDAYQAPLYCQNDNLTPTPSVCNDSDGGINYGVKGSANPLQVDQCFQRDSVVPYLAYSVNSCSGSGCELGENYCSKNQPTTLYVACSGECNDGACNSGKLADFWMGNLAMFGSSDDWNMNLATTRGKPLTIMYGYTVNNNLSTLPQPFVTFLSNGKLVNVSSVRCDPSTGSNIPPGYSNFQCTGKISTYDLQSGNVSVNISLGNDFIYGDYNLTLREGNYDNCKEIIPGWNDPAKQRLNVVLETFGYQNMSDADLRKLVSNVVDQDAHYHGMLSVEPFKSQSKRFNFWYINKSQDMSKCDNSSGWYNCGSASDAICPYNNQMVFVLVNNTQAYSYSGSDKSQVVYPISASDEFGFASTADQINSGNRVIMYLLGQKFGLLGEYGDSEANHTYSRSDSYMLNCYADNTSSEKSCVLNSPWASLLPAVCKENPRTCAVINDSNPQQLGCYEGCANEGNGIFRSTYNSIMRDYGSDPFSFGPWNEKVLSDELSHYEK